MNGESDRIHELLEKLAEALVDELVASAAPKLVAHLDALRMEKREDTLFTVSEAAKHIGLSSSTIRRLVECGEIHRAPGIKEIRIRRSTVDEYGKENR